MATGIGRNSSLYQQHAPHMDGRRPQATPYELAATGHELAFNQFPGGICGAVELPSSSSSFKAKILALSDLEKHFFGMGRNSSVN